MIMTADGKVWEEDKYKIVGCVEFKTRVEAAAFLNISEKNLLRNMRSAGKPKGRPPGPDSPRCAHHGQKGRNAQTVPKY